MDYDYKEWLSFWRSGSIQDYLNYKEKEKAVQNDNYNQGFSNQGTDYRGE